MYCPNCGSENQAQVKFCRRCGTGLIAVLAAMSRPAGDIIQPNQRLAELVKKYYAGRDQMIRGGLSIAAGVALLAIIFAVGKWGFFWIFLWVFMGVFGNGVRQFNKGWNEWSDANSELKALGYRRPPIGNNALPENPSSREISAPTDRNLARPSQQPPSVTESTTQLLDREKQ